MSDLLAASLIRDIPDFPKPGILFKDITPVLQNAPAYAQTIDLMREFAKKQAPDLIAGIESRGFLFGAPLALQMSLPFVPIRKVGKLPYETVQQTYDLEYGTASIELHRDACVEGARVLIVDDLLATGGTAKASALLLESIGAKVAGFAFLVELTFLPGREALRGYDVLSLIEY